MAYNNYGQNWMGQSGYYNYPVNGVQPTQPQSFAPQQPIQGMIWVDGEVGAKAFQMPAGWPVNTPIPLWDTNAQVVYLKSINQMGMPNPLQKLHYTMEEQQSGYLPAASAISGDHHEQYVTKEDFEQMKTELKEMLRANQSGKNQNNQQNRGGGQ